MAGTVEGAWSEAGAWFDGAGPAEGAWFGGTGLAEAQRGPGGLGVRRERSCGGPSRCLGGVELAGEGGWRWQELPVGPGRRGQGPGPRRPPHPAAPRPEICPRGANSQDGESGPDCPRMGLGRVGVAALPGGGRSSGVGSGGQRQKCLVSMY